MPYKFWTNKQIKQLSELAETMTAAEIGKQINRSRGAVLAKADSLGVVVIREHCNKRWTQQELDLFDTHTASQVAKLTGRTYNSAWLKLSQLRHKLAA